MSICLDPAEQQSPVTHTVNSGTYTHTQCRDDVMRVVSYVCVCSLIRWHIAGRSDCSSKCGPGHRTLDVLCMRYSQNKRQSERVESRACADLPKPQSREVCHGDCLQKSWQYSAWSQVTQTPALSSAQCSAACHVTVIM